MTDLRKLLDEARQWAADYRTGMAACDCDDDMCIHDEAMWRWRSIGKPDTFVLSMIGRVEPLAAALINADEVLTGIIACDEDAKPGRWPGLADSIDNDNCAYQSAALGVWLDRARAVRAEIRALTGGGE